MTRKRTSENDLVLSTGAPAPSRRKSGSRTRASRTPIADTTTPAPQPEIADQQAVAVVAETAAVVPEVEIVPEVAVVAEYVPDREEIARQAYLYWEGRGCQGGSSEEDWLRAEKELRLRTATA